MLLQLGWTIHINLLTDGIQGRNIQESKIRETSLSHIKPLGFILRLLPLRDRS